MSDSPTGDWRQAADAPTTPAVSVIMPAYNAERYLRAAIDSVLGQTFSDFELLIIDDGSKDGTASILAEAASRDPRVRWRSRANAGIVDTLNELIAAARAPLLARMDADDLCAPERLALQTARMAAEPGLVLLGTWFQIIDAEDRFVGFASQCEQHEDIDDSHVRGLVKIQHPSAMMRAETVRTLGGYDKRFELSEDLDLWLRMGEVGRVANVTEYLLRYRMIDTSLSATKEAAQDAANRAAVEAAWARRGITYGRNDYGPWRPRTREERRDRALRYTWFAWTRAEASTARHYARQAVRYDPLALPAWRALYATHLKRQPAPVPLPVAEDQRQTRADAIARSA